MKRIGLYNGNVKPSPTIHARFPFYPLLSIEGKRPTHADEILCKSISRFSNFPTGSSLLNDWLSGVKFSFEEMKYGGLTSKSLVRLNPRGLTEWTVVHELAHAWDASTGWQLSEKMRKFTHSRFPCRWLFRQFPGTRLFWYHVGSPPAPCGVDKNFNAREDFAESVTAFIFPEEAHRRAIKRKYPYEAYGYTHFNDTPRGKFIRDLFQQNQTPC